MQKFNPFETINFSRITRKKKERESLHPPKPTSSNDSLDIVISKISRKLGSSR